MTSRRYLNLADPGDEAEIIDILNAEDSDIDLELEDELETEDPPYVPNDAISEHSSNDEEDVVGNTTYNREICAEPSSRRVFWKATNTFEPLPPAPTYEVSNSIPVNLPPIDYFTKYIPSDTYDKIAFNSNQYYLINTGHYLSTSEVEIRTFFGITIIMSYLQYPRIRMYWEKATVLSRRMFVADGIGNRKDTWMSSGQI